jgi:hypothetical protein
MQLRNKDFLEFNNSLKSTVRSSLVFTIYEEQALKLFWLIRRKAYKYQFFLVIIIRTAFCSYVYQYGSNEKTITYTTSP